jgi:hypothetical protein
VLSRHTLLLHKSAYERHLRSSKSQVRGVNRRREGSQTEGTNGQQDLRSEDGKRLSSNPSICDSATELVTHNNPYSDSGCCVSHVTLDNDEGTPLLPALPGNLASGQDMQWTSPTAAGLSLQITARARIAHPSR